MSNPSPKFRLVDVDDLDPEQDATAKDDLIGTTIGRRYTIQAHLGGGGMADVYRARDEELGIDVAIKMLKPELATGEMRARMVQEARAAAQVRHPNLVRVFGTGKTAYSAYIAMELLDGPNLETYLRERPGGCLPWNEALELLLPALAALHAVHERGYVHRDIKPGNILVAHEPGCPPRAVVIDLGLVKPDRALRDVAGPPTTEVGRVLCTPGYASPEQAAQLPVDRRSDVYSMAITLYRVLAGRPPFHNARGKPIHVWFHHHVNVDPTLLVDAAGDAYIPPTIIRVIESGLAKDPADRPQTMLAFADALQAASIASSPPSRSPFHFWPYAIVVAQIIVLLFSWRLVLASGADSRAKHIEATIHHPVQVKVENESPTPAVTPPYAAPDPAPAPPTEQPPTIPENAAPEQPAAPRTDLAATTRRELARRVHAVQVCSDEDIGSVERLAVAVNIDTAGRVSAHVQDAADTTLSRCVAQVLQHRTPTPPPRPLSFVHIYKLRAITPRRP
jgi:serine/threonine protein kinase